MYRFASTIASEYSNGTGNSTYTFPFPPTHEQHPSYLISSPKHSIEFSSDGTHKSYIVISTTSSRVFLREQPSTLRAISSSQHAPSLSSHMEARLSSNRMDHFLSELYYANLQSQTYVSLQLDVHSSATYSMY